MKNLILLTGFVCLLISCNNSKAIADSEKLMRGNWIVTDVSINGVNENHVNINVFDEARAKCYEGSKWNLVQNNASGTYSLNGGNGCPTKSHKIKWFITEENGQSFFNFKRIYDGERPKHVVDGYKLRVGSNTGSQIVLVQDLYFEGKPITVNYTFNKN